MSIILDGLDEQQRQAAERTEGAVCIVAGAGTGKTRTVTHKIAHAVLTGATDPKKILPLTHSQKAAGEMRHRLSTLRVGEVSARTFHAAALRQLKFFWAQTGRNHDFALLDNKYPLVRRALEKSRRTKASNDEVFDATSEIGWAKTQLLTPAQYQNAALKAGRAPGLQLEEVSDIYRAYESLKSTAGKLDFEDLLTVLADLIESDEEVRFHVHSTYDTFVVDEYQDVDPLQLRLLKAWLGDRDNITVVGDPRQSIYSFKGATADAFKAFRTDHPDAFEIQLVKDYRSTPQVVSAANTLIGDPSTSLIGQKPSGPVPEVKVFPTENVEEKFVVQKIKELRSNGVPLAEMAVLYRFNSQSARFEAALTSAGIPYVVADSERFFERPEVKGVLSELWRASRRAPDRVGIESLGDVLANIGFDRDSPPAGAGAARARFEAVSALLTMIEDLPGIETLGVTYLVDELAHRASEAHQVVQEGVTLSTLHKAKGLEWESVFMVNMTEGALPSSYAVKPVALEEERRLAYVGVTRAKKDLFLTYAQANSKGWKAKPSRFLSAFGAAKSTTSPRKRASSPRSKPLVARPVARDCKDCKTPLPPGLQWVGVCSACMPQDLSTRAEALISWRRERGSETGKTPGDFMHDSLLWKIALKNPSKLSEIVLIEEFGSSNASAFGRDIIALLKR